MSDILRLVRDGCLVLVIGIGIYCAIMATLPEKRPYEICGTVNVFWDVEEQSFKCPDNWGG